MIPTYGCAYHPWCFLSLKITNNVNILTRGSRLNSHCSATVYTTPYTPIETSDEIDMSSSKVNLNLYRVHDWSVRSLFDMLGFAMVTYLC